MSLIASTFRGIGGLLRYSLRVFALTLLTVNLLYGLLLAAVAVWIASDGSLVRGIIAGVLTAILVVILGLIAAIQFTAMLTISRAIKEAAIGRRVFDAIFDIALGISDDNPGGRLNSTQSVQGLSVAEVESRLMAAGRQLLAQENASSTISGITLWLANRIQRVLVWATIKVVVRSCTSGGPQPTVDLIQLRSRLAGVIDNEIADYLKQHSTRLVFSLAGVVTGLAILIASGIRHLPL